MNRFITSALFLFAFSFCVFAIQSGDVVMYLALARDFILSNATSSSVDPYLYSLKNAELVWQHEYLSYLYFDALYQVLGAAGLILAKLILLSAIFITVLRARSPEQNRNLLWILLWTLAVLAGSFRFIERASQFSDLFCVGLALYLADRERLSRLDILKLCALFGLWIQLHPGYPLGIALLGAWWLHRLIVARTLRPIESLWLLLPLAVLLINPLGLEGALYPFQFSLNEAQVLKRSNFEWFPAYHKAFRWAPETIAFWVLSLTLLVILIKEKLFLEVRAWLSVAAIASALMAIRFVPWAAFASLALMKPWVEFTHPRLRHPALSALLCAGLVLVAAKNLTFGYTASSGARIVKLGFDPKFFPFESLKFLRANPIPGRLYNTHDFGSFLIWQQYTPIFHHGFVTDMDFYANDVMGLFRGQSEFIRLAKKYGWTMLLVEKYGAYKYFHKILSPLTDWKIVAEDESSYLIYYLPETPTAR